MNIYDLTSVADRTIGKVLAAQALHNHEGVWLRADEEMLTFGEADLMANRLANGLAAHGVTKGQIVAMLMHPNLDAVVIAVAAARLGAVFTNISTEYKGDFLSDALEQSGATILIADAELCAALETAPSLGAVETLFVRGELPSRSLPVSALPLDALRSPNDSAPQVDVAWHDPFQIWWSSGTTGKSKGIMHSHSSILHLAGVYSKEHRPGDSIYSCTPIYLGSSWNGAIWRSLVSGLPVAIDQKFSVTAFWERTRYYGVTHIMTFGAMHILLLQQAERADDAQNPVRRAESIPMPYSLIPEFKRRFGIERMDQCYGQSETFIVARARDDGTQWEKSAIGYPEPYYNVIIVDENDVEIPPHQPGEICVRPKARGVMFDGYLNQPEATLAAWRSLWHHTGDMAYRDEAGILYFVDRKKDYIRYLGRNISMFEVESVLLKHDAIHEAAALGIVSNELEFEAELMVGVVLKGGATLAAEELARYVNGAAPYYFVPRYIRFLPELPRNPHGRVVKFKIGEEGVTADTWDRIKAGFVIER